MTERTVARSFVAAFLALLLACGFAGVEAWPFSAFRLFSAARTEIATGWRVSYLDAEGTARPYPSGAMGVAFSGTVHVAAGFGRLRGDEQVVVCRAYLDAARDIGLDARSLRIDRVERQLAVRVGDRSPPGRVIPTFRCDGNRVEDLR